MKNIFLSTSFSGQVNYETGEVKPVFRNQIETILTALRNMGFVVFCAVEHEGWVISNDGPEVGVQKDISELDKADVLLALLHDKPSAGVQYEMGYAAAKGKKVFVTVEKDGELAYFNQGLANLDHITQLSLNSPELLAQELATRI